MSDSSKSRSRPWSKECKDCGRYLTATEEHFYEYRCADCEALEHARIQAWRAGAEDLDMDERYSQ